jgi:hypothetical protein
MTGKVLTQTPLPVMRSLLLDMHGCPFSARATRFSTVCRMHLRHVQGEGLCEQPYITNSVLLRKQFGLVTSLVVLNAIVG